MLILSVRPAIAAALASKFHQHHGAIEVRPPSDVFLAGASHEVILLDAIGVSRAYDRLAELADSFPGARRVVLVSRPSDLAAQMARRAGAHAILSESDSSATWSEIFARLPDAEFITGASFRGAPAICARLTERQLEVYLLAVLGISDEEIGVRLGMAIATAETHRRDAQIRLGCAGNRELIAHALRHGLVDASDVDLRPSLRQSSRRHAREPDLV